MTKRWYRAYGLTVTSEIPLPELGEEVSPTEAVRDEHGIQIRLTEVASPEVETIEIAGEMTSVTATATYLRFADVGAFRVSDGRSIDVDLLPHCAENVARLFVLGAALGVCLHQRGFLVLHASAVRKANEAVAFMAHSGHGKSTMASALLQHGFSFLTDDIVVADLTADPVRVFPGFPYMKLWPDAAESTGVDPDNLPPLRPDMQKLGRAITSAFSSERATLRHLYVLEVGPAIEIEKLDAQDSLVELLRHSYCARIMTREDSIRHLHQCALLVRNTPIRRLRRPRDLSQLRQVADKVTEDAFGPVSAGR